MYTGSPPGVRDPMNTQGSHVEAVRTMFLRVMMSLCNQCMGLSCSPFWCGSVGSLAAGGDDSKFIEHPLFIHSHEVAGIQDGTTVPQVWVYVDKDKVLLVLWESFDMLPEDLVAKQQQRLDGFSLGRCWGILSGFGDVADFIANWSQGFNNTPALVYQNQLGFNGVKLLWGPVNGTHLIFVQNLLVAVWIKVPDHNNINEGSG